MPAVHDTHMEMRAVEEIFTSEREKEGHGEDNQGCYETCNTMAHAVF